MLMAPHDIPALYVQDYIKLVGTDDGVAGFQKVLEMKGEFTAICGTRGARSERLLTHA